jgi:hypothetical protein
MKHFMPIAFGVVFSWASDYLSYCTVTPSETKTEHMRTTHAPSFLTTLKVLSKLLVPEASKLLKIINQLLRVY